MHTMRGPIEGHLDLVPHMVDVDVDRVSDAGGAQRG